MTKLKICLKFAFFLIFSTQVNAQIIEFDTNSQSLGEINLKEVKDSTLFCDFSFTNVGDKPLRIKYTLATCGCTTSSWSKESYDPGAKGTIRLAYNPHIRSEQDVTMFVDVYTNSLNSGIQKGVHSLKMDFELTGERIPILPHYKLERGEVVVKNRPAQDIYDTILDRIACEFQEHFSSSSDVLTEQLASTMREGGYWQHIDYACFFRTNWEPIIHLENLRTMAVAYITPASKYYGSPSLFNIINEGLQYWDITNPTSHNWWYNQIGGSQTLADILVLLSRGQERINGDLLNNLSVKLSNSDSKEWTGANKLDIAKHHLYRGCLLRDDALVRSSVEESFFAVRITREEGIQEDMSYQQHGAQLYMGGYGIVFVAGIADLAYILRETPYALPKGQLEIFSRFLREGFFKVFRSSYIDWSVTGRGISRKDIIANINLASTLNKISQIDPEHSEFYEQTKERFVNKDAVSVGVEPQNILFYRTDYMVHNQPKYQATVRTVSTRCIKAENGNGENLLGAFQSDGAFNIRQQGDEYLNIFPVWEWNKIPGVTSPKEIPTIAASWRVKGTSEWTGGVSDGDVGAYAYVHDDHGFKATKGWFFWDNMVVALGAGITSEEIALHTTLDQSHLRGEVKFKETQREITTDSIDTALNNLQYVIHNKMAYIPLQQGKLTLKASPQVGNWININYNQANLDIQERVFNLIWEHPKGEVNASYGYIQLPDCSSAREIDKIKRSISVVNTPTLQAAYKKEDNKAMMLFYDKGSYEVGKWSISVNKPALFIVHGVNKISELKITLVNLSGDSSPVEVKLDNSKNSTATLNINTTEMKPSTINFTL